tara:strand:+ start:2016 stop:2246 length:231 start_codon:yes stop_codon:yes gene_type:complete
MAIKTIKLCGKTVDRCAITYLDEKGEYVGERDCYVPDYFPEQHDGDYIEFDIDVKTGQILNWKTPTQKQLKDSIQS